MNKIVGFTEKKKIVFKLLSSVNPWEGKAAQQNGKEVIIVIGSVFSSFLFLSLVPFSCLSCTTEEGFLDDLKPLTMFLKKESSQTMFCIKTRLLFESNDRNYFIRVPK